MPEDPQHATHAKVAALRIVTLLQQRYRLPEIEAEDLHRIAGYIDEAIVDARRLDEMKRVATQPSDDAERE